MARDPSYRHKTVPTLYAYQQGCPCADCKSLHNKSVQEYNARRKAKRDAAKAEPPAVVGPIETAVAAGFDGMAEMPWQTVWKLLALQHARTLDTITVSGQLHLAGTAHAKLAECLDRLRPPTPPAVQGVKQGVSDLEAFANDL